MKMLGPSEKSILTRAKRCNIPEEDILYSLSYFKHEEMITGRIQLLNTLSRGYVTATRETVFLMCQAAAVILVAKI
jgi:hypothetical protein